MKSKAMSCLLFKLGFDAPVHFGPSQGAQSLYSSQEHFLADTLFSALCHTALSTGGAEAVERLCGLAREEELLLSDAMPWRGDELYLPKPCITAKESGQDVPASVRKAVKKLKWIPVSGFGAFAASLAGGEVYVPEDRSAFGIHQSHTRAAITQGEDALPYQVGSFRFYEDCGLWFLCMCREEDAGWIQALVRSLGYSGIGGKVSSGYGSFHIEDLIWLDEPFDAQTRWLAEGLQRSGGSSLLLTTCLPRDEELDEVISSASYRLERRGGFVQSQGYSPEPVKKETQYFLAAGSVVKKRFKGDIYQVGDGGRHPVLRYSRPIFLGVEL